LPVKRYGTIPDPPPWTPPSVPSLEPPPLAGKSPEVRAAEIIAAALLEVAKSVDRLTEAVKDSGDDAAHS